MSHELLSDVAYERLSHAILTGEIPENARISVPRLCQELGFSRTPVSAALQRLRREGIIEVHASRFTRVASVSPERLQESLRLAVHLAGAALRLMLRHGSHASFLRELRSWERSLLTGDAGASLVGFLRCFDALTLCAEGTLYFVVMTEMRLALERDLGARPQVALEQTAGRVAFARLRNAVDGDDPEEAVGALEDLLGLIFATAAAADPRTAAIGTPAVA